LLDRVGVFYTVGLLTVMASFALEVLFSLFYSLAVRRSLRLTRQKQQSSEQQSAEEQEAEEQKAEEPNPAEPNTEAPNTEEPAEASRAAEQS
ncbi:MAG: amino acid transporter, partial [Rothia mucilaginosa]|nr:amino acid transporter [Rothia mucilaginosa]